MMISPLARSDLAPTGTLRVGINYGNPVLATVDPTSGNLRGLAVDLAQELGRRVGVAIALVGYDTIAKLVEELKSAAWDVAFLAIEPGRAGEINFTAPCIEVEGTCLVPVGSSLCTIADVDREGVRIAIPANSAVELFLSRTLKSAHLVRTPGPDAAFKLLVEGTVEAYAGLRQTLIRNAEKFPGSRVLDGRFMVIQQALGIPKGRDAGAKYLREFIEDVKASGLVAQAIEKAGIRGVLVAPEAPIQPNS
jgi:polar amino acid transport system substrate-binding protein